MCTAVRRAAQSVSVKPSSTASRRFKSGQRNLCVRLICPSNIADGHFVVALGSMSDIKTFSRKAQRQNKARYMSPLLPAAPRSFRMIRLKLRIFVSLSRCTSLRCRHWSGSNTQTRCRKVQMRTSPIQQQNRRWSAGRQRSDLPLKSSKRMCLLPRNISTSRRRMWFSIAGGQFQRPSRKSKLCRRSTCWK